MKKVSGLMLVQQDLQELINRLNNRMDEALRLFGQKRSRDHFEHVFFNRYKEFSISTLQDLDEEVYPRIVSIYEEVDETYWYLMSTEDMPSLVRNNIDSSLKNINKHFSEVIGIFTSELEVENESYLEQNHENITEQEEVLDLEESPPPINEIDANEET